ARAVVRGGQWWARTDQRVAKSGPAPTGPGKTTSLPIYALHRHEELWRDPDRFDPDRFEAQAVAARDRFAYLPFGAGPRLCIGQGFANIEAVARLATPLSRFRLRLPSGSCSQAPLRGAPPPAA